jgi:diguanylate cyclase (GGDEF)-like protein
MTTDFELWQWSLLTQLASGVLLASFFVVYGRGFRTAAVRAWTHAWVANLVALLVTLADVYLVEGTPGLVLQAIFAVYIAARLYFVVAMLEGVAAATVPERRLWAPRIRTAAIVVVALATAVTVTSFTVLGLLAQTIVAVGFLGGTVLALLHIRQPVAWLAIGLSLRVALGVAEVVGYASQTTPALLTLPWSAALISSLLAVSSFFDTIADWLLAFGCVLAASARARRELALTNEDLLKAQAALRNMVDVDSLTGLANRRALAAILRDAQPQGASLVFIDLRDFKHINDAHGHAVGDDVLRRFARALRESFRPDDAVVRYAGDEFLVVARGLEHSAMVSRVDALRATLSVSGGEPRIRFDAGHAALEPGGLPDEAIRAADEAMYDAKQREKRMVSAFRQ